MIKMFVSNGLILSPESKTEAVVLWALSIFTGKYSKTCNNPYSYPLQRRLKIGSRSNVDND